MVNDEELISTNYSCGDTIVSISFSDEPMRGSIDQLRSILLSSYTELRERADLMNLPVDKKLAA